jgi:hypothetical protein
MKGATLSSTIGVSRIHENKNFLLRPIETGAAFPKRPLLEERHVTIVPELWTLFVLNKGIME